MHFWLKYMGYWSWASDVPTSPSETAAEVKVVFLNNKHYSQHSERLRRLIIKYQECINRTWNTLLHSLLPISSHLPTPPISGIQKPSNVQKANISQQSLITAVFLTENRKLNIYRFEKYHFITTPLILRKLRCCARNELIWTLREIFHILGKLVCLHL
jgi:hypothetical protein